MRLFCRFSSYLDWPIAVVVFTCVGLISVLVLYLIVRVRSNNRQLNSSANNGDDIHSQMEWEDDIGLNITVNPLDETKVCLDYSFFHVHYLSIECVLFCF